METLKVGLVKGDYRRQRSQLSVGCHGALCLQERMNDSYLEETTVARQHQTWSWMLCIHGNLGCLLSFVEQSIPQGTAEIKKRSVSMEYSFLPGNGRKHRKPRHCCISVIV